MLGESKIDDVIAMAKRLEQMNANPKMKKKYWDRDVRQMEKWDNQRWKIIRSVSSGLFFV